MSTSDKKIVVPTVVRRPAKERGALSSADFNDFVEETVNDIVNLSSAVNSLSSSLTKMIVTLQNENAYLRRQVDSIRNQNTYVEKSNGSYGYVVSRFLDLNDTTGVFYPNDTNDSFSIMVNAEYGEATLPVNAIENKFFITSLTSGKIILPPDLSIGVTSLFDKGTGDGVVDYERGGIVTPGKPEWAVDGYPSHYWIRRVEFPIDSRVDQVECEFTVTVPDGTSSEANLIELTTFPNGTVDITSVSTASDLGDNYIVVPGFTPQDNMVATRWHFSSKTVEQIKIRMRQRNWVEESGKKVFYYGINDLSLKLVDYDKKWVPGSAFGSSNTFVIKVDAPAGFGFDVIYRIDPEPNFFLEDLSSRHIHVRLSTSPDFSGQKWDSDTFLPPQKTSEPLRLGGNETIYVIVMMNFVESSSGSLSPFPVGTTPYFKGLGLTYSLKEI